MTNVNKQTFSIGDAAKMTGATQKQIRHWEASGFIPLVERLVCGERSFRRFTMDDVETIRKIKDYLDEGFTLSSAVNKAFGKNPVKEGSDNE
jgi:DNA-binding transcriptional MerR regulator